MKKTTKKVLKKQTKTSRSKKAHPWRLCPLGQHWRRTHPYHVASSKKHPSGSTATQRGHCRDNPSKKDHLYKDEIQEIADQHFKRLKGAPKSDDLGFKELGNKFDFLIRGWTRYWNEVLEVKDPLDPDLVKALIASESSFKPDEWNHRRGGDAAYGLMQVLNASVQLLKDPRELRDHYVDLDNGDMVDPNLSICAGIRWLFRKKELAKGAGGVPASWREAIAAYKSVKPTDKKLMPRFDKYYDRLKGVKK